MGAEQINFKEGFLMTNDIKIMAHPKTDPSLCDFVLEAPIEKFGAYVFDKTESKGSALAEALLALEGVSSVVVIGQTISIKKESSVMWQVLGKQIGAAIREAYKSGKPLIGEKAKERSQNEKQLLDQARGVIANQINPAVASHGGYIDLIDVHENDLFIRMGGGCQGCSSSAATLKQGVEQTLKEQIPALGQIIDTTDHAAGTNPYF